MILLIARWHTRQKGTVRRDPMMHSASGRYSPRASYRPPSNAPTLPACVSGVGMSVPGSTRSRHFNPGRIEQRSEIRLPRLDGGPTGGLIGHAANVLVSEPGKVVRELMDEDILGGAIRRRDRRLLVEDSASAVPLIVDEDSNHIVRCRRGEVAESPVVGGQCIALDSEDVEFNSDWHSSRLQQSDVEVRSAGFERLEREQCFDKTGGVGAKFRKLGRGVPFTKQQHVHFGARRPALEKEGNAGNRFRRG